MRRTDYDRIADTYDGGLARADVHADPDLGEVLERRAEAAVLDVGCGTGTFLAVQRDAFAGREIAWHGLDASEAMLRRARAKLPEAALTVGRAEALPYDDGAFAFVGARFAFHHFDDKERALDELVRVRAADGALKIVNICPEHMPRWWIYRWFPAAVALDGPRFWPTDRLFEALEARGLAPRLTVEVRRTRHPLAELLEEARRRDVSELAILDDADYEAGVAAMEEALAADPSATFLDQLALATCVA